MFRRQLNREQKRQIIADQLKRHPEKSNNAHAHEIGVSDMTVRSVRDELESTSQIRKLDKTVGAELLVSATRYFTISRTGKNIFHCAISERSRPALMSMTRFSQKRRQSVSSMDLVVTTQRPSSAGKLSLEIS